MDTRAAKRGPVANSLARIRTANAKIVSLSSRPSSPAALVQQIALCRKLLRDLAIVRDRVRRPSSAHQNGIPFGTRRRRQLRRLR
jgi:hypothetical protein